MIDASSLLCEDLNRGGVNPDSVAGRRTEVPESMARATKASISSASLVSVEVAALEARKAPDIGRGRGVLCTVG